jgi:hypothetical protein
MASMANAPREYVILRSIVIPSLSESVEQPLPGLVAGSCRERECGQDGCGEEQAFQT